MSDATPDLAALERLAKEASELPWSNNLDLDPPDPGIEAGGGGCVAHVQCHGNINTVARTGEEFSHADARYIVAACNALPSLTARVRAAEAERDRLRKRLVGGPVWKASPDCDCHPCGYFKAANGNCPKCGRYSPDRCIRPSDDDLIAELNRVRAERDAARALNVVLGDRLLLCAGLLSWRAERNAKESQ